MVGLQAAVLALAAVTSGDPVLLDFYADWCGPCQQMTRIVDQLAAQGYPIRKVNVDNERQLAAQYRVEGIPCFVLVVDGREVDRQVGAASTDSLKRLFSKAGVPPGQNQRQTAASQAAALPTDTAGAAAFAPPAAVPPPVAGLPPSLNSFIQPGGSQSDGNHTLPPTTAADASPFASAGPPAASLPAVSPFNTTAPLAATALAGTAPLTIPSQPSSAPIGVSQQPQDAPPASATSGAIQADVAPLMAASVRLKIEDATGHSYGSGTIIDVRGDQALILTCGHIFRDSGGKGGITIDMFGPGAPRGVVGHVVGYDAETRDVGLVSFRPGVPVQPVPLAPVGFRAERGQPVVSIGCDNGNDPSVRESRISAIDKYLGPPNLEVAGQPTQGRSGGGLFSAQGQLIGVCNAADPSDNEGLFAALPNVQALLDREGLSSVYQHSAGAALAQAGGPSLDPLAPLVDVRPPQMPGSMPQAPPANLPLTSTPEQFAGQSAASLSPSEQAAINGMQSASGAEVVCVIRSPNDPTAKSQIIVIDRASPALMQQLAAEQQQQGARQLTSLAANRREPPIRVINPR